MGQVRMSRMTQSVRRAKGADILIVNKTPLSAETPVSYTHLVVAEARRRELDRGGQAYYIHNRIDTIDQCAAKLAELLPGARIATAHGLSLIHI